LFTLDLRMAEHYIFLRTTYNGRSSDSNTIKLEVADLQNNVASFKQKTAQLVGFSPAEIDMFYCGRILKDSIALSAYNIQSGVTLLVTNKLPSSVQLSPEPFDAADLQKVSSAIRIRHQRNFQEALEKTVSNSATIDRIVQKNSQLASDHIAIALLQDADLLMLTLTDSTARLRVFEAHPALGNGVVELMEIVGKELNKSSSSASATSRRQYNMDRMDSEDEPEDDEMEVNSNQPAVMPAAVAGQPITTDFFQQAMLAATGLALPTPAAAPAAPPVVVTEAQLQQLRDMGIYDEELARRALQASNGDLQAALEIIFGDDM